MLGVVIVGAEVAIFAGLLGAASLGGGVAVEVVVIILEAAAKRDLEGAVLVERTL